MKKLEKTELKEMKEITDEEYKIAEALKRFSNTIKYPLLDIWSWSWKISSNAFWDNKVIHIDPLEFSNEDFQLPEGHERIVWNFFEFNNTKQQIKTLLFCHSLQYLDDNGIESVINKIKEINPEFVLLVINNNDWILWEILSFFKTNNRKENWEKHFKEFPWNNFSLLKEEGITGNFYCKNIKEVTHTICRLLLDTTISKEQEKKTHILLRNQWINNEFEVKQKVILYKNNQFKNE